MPMLFTPKMHLAASPVSSPKPPQVVSSKRQSFSPTASPTSASSPRSCLGSSPKSGIGLEEALAVQRSLRRALEQQRGEAPGSPLPSCRGSPRCTRRSLPSSSSLSSRQLGQANEIVAHGDMGLNASCLEDVGRIHAMRAEALANEVEEYMQEVLLYGRGSCDRRDIKELSVEVEQMREDSWNARMLQRWESTVELASRNREYFARIAAQQHGRDVKELSAETEMMRRQLSERRLAERAHSATMLANANFEYQQRLAMTTARDSKALSVETEQMRARCAEEREEQRTLEASCLASANKHYFARVREAGAQGKDSKALEPETIRSRQRAVGDRSLRHISQRMDLEWKRWVMSCRKAKASGNMESLQAMVNQLRLKAVQPFGAREQQALEAPIYVSGSGFQPAHRSTPSQTPCPAASPRSAVTSVDTPSRSLSEAWTETLQRGMQRSLDMQGCDGEKFAKSLGSSCSSVATTAPPSPWHGKGLRTLSQSSGSWSVRSSLERASF